ASARCSPPSPTRGEGKRVCRALGETLPPDGSLVDRDRSRMWQSEIGEMRGFYANRFARTLSFSPCGRRWPPSGSEGGRMRGSKDNKSKEMKFSKMILGPAHLCAALMLAAW